MLVPHVGVLLLVLAAAAPQIIMCCCDDLFVSVILFKDASLKV